MDMERAKRERSDVVTGSSGQLSGEGDAEHSEGQELKHAEKYSSRGEGEMGLFVPSRYL